jgi:hypothetical protein
MVPLTTFPKTTLIFSNDLEKFSCTAGKIDNLPFEYFFSLIFVYFKLNPEGWGDT